MSTSPIIHYFFVQSPWSFFGFRRAVNVARKNNVPIIHKPCRSADVWEHGGGKPLAQRPKPRQEYRLVEMKRWAEFLDIPINFQPQFFPADEKLAARTIIAVQNDGKDPADFIEALMQNVWLNQRNIADPAIIAEELRNHGLSEDYMKIADSDEIHAIYDSNCEEARRDNIFGVPTYFVDGEMFWGQDRLDFVDRALAKRAAK